MPVICPLQDVRLFCVRAVAVAVESLNHISVLRVHEWDSDDCGDAIVDVVALQHQIGTPGLVGFLLECIADGADR